MSKKTPHGALPFLFPGVQGVKCLFSTALSGNMSLEAEGPAPQGAIERRAEFMAHAGFSRWAELRQVHGDVIVQANVISRLDAAPVIEADGQYTTEAGVGLIIKTADCQPVLLARKDGKAVAALHVGWRGNVLDVPGKAVALLCERFSCGPKDLLIVRGPSLGPNAAEFVNFTQEWPGEFAPWLDTEHATMNLWGLTCHQLKQAGVPRRQIFGLDFCTHTQHGSFFSYRRGHSGRQISSIWIEQ